MKTLYLRSRCIKSDQMFLVKLKVYELRSVRNAVDYCCVYYCGKEP